MNKTENTNYMARVAAIDEVNKILDCDNIQEATVLNCPIITGINTKVGDIGLFFSEGTELSPKFLYNNNLFSNAQMNKDKSVKGYFGSNGRVRPIKLRGAISEGVFFPLSALNYIDESTGKQFALGDSFDMIGSEVICKKYEPMPEKITNIHSKDNRKKIKRNPNRILPEHFKLHGKTLRFTNELPKLQPDDKISISEKLHGTSAVFGNVLVKKNLSLFKRILLYLGFDIKTTEYDLIYASRNIIKNARKSDTYTTDVYGEWAKKLQNKLPEDYTIYGEIVGYTKRGKTIQKGYNYGCDPFESKFFVYKIKYKDSTLPFDAMTDFCYLFNLDIVPLHYVGIAKDLYDIPTEDISYWHKQFLKRLRKDKSLGMDNQKQPLCNGKPTEGIVIRKEQGTFPVYKLKNFDFLSQE